MTNSDLVDLETILQEAQEAVFGRIASDSDVRRIDKTGPKSPPRNVVKVNETAYGILEEKDQQGNYIVMINAKIPKDAVFPQSEWGGVRVQDDYGGFVDTVRQLFKDNGKNYDVVHQKAKVFEKDDWDQNRLVSKHLVCIRLKFPADVPESTGIQDQISTAMYDLIEAMESAKKFYS